MSEIDAEPAQETEAVTAADTSTDGDAAATAEAQPADGTAPASDNAKDAAPGGAAVSTGETDELADLTTLSKEERRQYAEHLKLLPAEARKTFNRILDQKFRSAADERKRLGAWATVAESFEKDPHGTLKALQDHVAGKPARAAPQVDPEVMKLIESRLDDSTKPLAPIVAPLVSAIIQHEMAPVRQFIETQRQQAQAAEAQTILVEFEKAHPDWQAYQDVMIDLGAKFKPLVDAGEMSHREVLEAAYTLASAEARVSKAASERVDKVLEKVTKAAANAEPDSSDVSPARSTVRKPPASAEEAYRLAQQGIEVEY